jgi:uncharacterized protein involved in exopolysaccharide biosynthesis
MTSPARSGEERVDVADVARLLLRGWRIIGASFLACVLLGVGFLLWVAPVWTAKSSVLVRDSSPMGGALAQQLTGCSKAAT